MRVFAVMRFEIFEIMRLKSLGEGRTSARGVLSGAEAAVQERLSSVTKRRLSISVALAVVLGPGGSRFGKLLKSYIQVGEDEADI